MGKLDSIIGKTETRKKYAKAVGNVLSVLCLAYVAWVLYDEIEFIRKIKLGAGWILAIAIGTFFWVGVNFAIASGWHKLFGCLWISVNST